MFAKSSTILYACPRSHLHHGPNIPDFLSRESLTALFLLWGGGGVALRSMRKKGVGREGIRKGGVIGPFASTSILLRLSPRLVGDEGLKELCFIQRSTFALEFDWSHFL